MKKIFFIIQMIFFFVLVVKAQDDVYPTPPQKGTLFITNATIHVGNGTVINNGTIKITDGKLHRWEQIFLLREISLMQKESRFTRASFFRKVILV